MNLEESTILDALLKGNYITPEDAKIAQKDVEKNKGSLVEYLISKELITRELLGQAMAEKMGVPYADLSSKPPTAEYVQMLPEEFA